MNEIKVQLVKQWLLKSYSDLRSAKILSTGEEKRLDTAIYHCQQSAEKATKAFLIYQDHELIKSHDIGKLVELAIGYHSDFEQWLDIAESLTQYATVFRYPGDIFEPDVELFNKTLEDTENFFHFVLSILPEEFNL
jgi:HEPN domain-containing protein